MTGQSGSAVGATPATAAELERQIAQFEHELDTARTKAVNAARMNDLEAESEALSAIELLTARLGTRRSALDQARLDEAAAATTARDAAIDQIVATRLPALHQEIQTAVTVAQRDRTAEAVLAVDLACRRLSALRSRLFELTNDMQRFHPQQSPHPSRLLRDDPALEAIWRRVRTRGPIDTTEIYAGLPPA